MIRKLFSLLIVCAIAISVLAIDVKINLLTSVPVAKTAYFELTPGTSLRALAAKLQQQGLTTRPLYIVAYARLNGISTRLQAGEYSVEPGMSVLDLLRKMQNGEVRLYSFTIVEGWTFRQLLDALGKNEALQRTIDRNTDTGRIVMRALGRPDVHPEGQFLPDTYLFAKGTTDIEFLRRANSALQNRLQSEWEGRAPGLPLRTPYEALILASIIEKETAVTAERPLIAAVFVNRLNKRMRLQTDPTVIYGLGEGFDGNIRFRDLRQDTPYNTYTRAGLPPTPIALPGAEAIHAALHPQASPVLYFVSRGDGSHVFSADLATHEAAVDQYQRRAHVRSR
ncbi:MAG TPA: endolytic transglycosylase MltG [Gammaproteobacteria bacterium]|nr:endolytic transglycosylase MltG [Gammaproteobacteria bacterium]